MTGVRLLEREGEYELLAAALDGAESGCGRLVVIDGEAGAGKSALLAAALELAYARRARVAVAHGGLLEQEVGWGVVRQLFEPVVLGPGRVDGLLEGPSRAAAAVFGLSAPPVESAFPVDAAPGLEHALFRLAVTLAEAGSLVVSVDDAHWADEASLRWLVYLGRRIERLPIVVLVARRIGEPSSRGTLLDDLGAIDGVTGLAPAPLTEAATAVLAGARSARRRILGSCVPAARPQAATRSSSASCSASLPPKAPRPRTNTFELSVRRRWSPP